METAPAIAGISETASNITMTLFTGNSLFHKVRFFNVLRRQF